MLNSFTIKSLEIELRQDSGSQIICGQACEVEIVKPGLPALNSAKVKIWGLSYLDLVNLTTLSFQPMESIKKQIFIKAGDEGGEMSQVFAGEISSAWADFNPSPDVYLYIEAKSGFYPARLAEPPLSINGEAPAADLISQQASLAGYSFKNEGVSASVRNAVFNGSPLEKAQAIAKQVGAEIIIDDNEVIILPSGGARGGGAAILTAQNGMAGYPTFNESGIMCKCLYRQDIKLGGLVNTDSIVPKARGIWKIAKLTHKLAAYHPKQTDWFTSIEGHIYNV